MVKFRNRTVRVNEMAGKVYVEVKNKSFNQDREVPGDDEMEVKVFDTVADAEAYINKSFPVE